MIYFAQAVDGGPIKIGHTIRLAERVTQLQATTVERLRVLGVMDGAFDEERSLHERFDRLRLEPTHRCEWFRPEPELLDFIRAEGRPWQPSDDAPVNRLKNILILRGSEEWKTWAEEVAEANGASLAVTMDQAMRELGERLEVRKPPRRVP